jgi:hypothetical protein
MVMATWLSLLGAGPGHLYPGQQHGDPARTGGRRWDGEHGPQTTDRPGAAVMTLPPHAVARLGNALFGPTAAVAALDICALAPAWTRLRAGAGRDSRAVHVGRRDSGAVLR